MPKATKPPIPPLAFGLARANVDLDLHQMLHRVGSMTKWASDFDELKHDGDFHHKTAFFASDDVRMIAVASTPTVMKVSAPDLTIAIPMQGSFQTWVGKRQFVLDGPAHAMYYPEGTSETTSSPNFLLQVGWVF